MATQMNAISRRTFLQMVGASALAVMALSLSAFGGGKTTSRRIRVRMVSFHPRAAEMAFCQRARFASAADAMRALASRGMAAEIYRE